LRFDGGGGVGGAGVSDTGGLPFSGTRRGEGMELVPRGTAPPPANAPRRPAPPASCATTSTPGRPVEPTRVGSMSPTPRQGAIDRLSVNRLVGNALPRKQKYKRVVPDRGWKASFLVFSVGARLAPGNAIKLLLRRGRSPGATKKGQRPSTSIAGRSAPHAGPSSGPRQLLGSTSHTPGFPPTTGGGLTLDRDARSGATLTVLVEPTTIFRRQPVNAVPCPSSRPLGPVSQPPRLALAIRGFRSSVQACTPGARIEGRLH